MSTPKLLTGAQLADALNLHPKVVAKHTRQGRYDTFAINLAPAGRQPIWRYDPRGLEKWLDARRNAA
jgi:hypothetical protein